ncbi:MAG: choice-of-anchor Q domain-containing protein, partial [Albidovulum sp.]
SHKNGTPSNNVNVTNNMTTAMRVTADPAKKIAIANNIVVTNATGEFTSVTQRDFTLKSNSKGVDAGSVAAAPKADIAGTPRPKGKAPDAGAYESF